MTLNSTLKYHTHISNKINSYNNACYALGPLLKSNMNTKSKITLYKSGNRPTLTYASEIWNNISKSRINRLESLQNKILRKILHEPFTIPLSTLRRKTKTTTLSRWLDDKAISFYNTSTRKVPHTSELAKSTYTCPLTKKRTTKLPHSIIIPPYTET